MASYSQRGVHGQVVHRLGARIVRGEYAEGDTLDVKALGQAAKTPEARRLLDALTAEEKEAEPATA